MHNSRVCFIYIWGGFLVIKKDCIGSHYPQSGASKKVIEKSGIIVPHFSPPWREIVPFLPLGRSNFRGRIKLGVHRIEAMTCPFIIDSYGWHHGSWVFLLSLKCEHFLGVDKGHHQWYLIAPFFFLFLFSLSSN